MILTINGSSRPNENNGQLLRAMSMRYSQYDFTMIDDLSTLPMYLADQEKERTNEEVINYRTQVQSADAVIMATPEYIHNIPALLKNALEWLTESGELFDKPVLPITYTPNSPRGKKAMSSLLDSLMALNAKVGGSLELYQNELTITPNLILQESFSLEILDASMIELMN